MGSILSLTSNIFEEYPVKFATDNSVSLKSISTRDCDLFTTYTYGELIKNQFNERLSYFIAAWQDNETSKVHLGDGFSFLRNYYSHDSKISPLTRNPLNSFNIYQIRPFAKEAELLCNKAELDKTDSIFRHLIGSHDREFPISTRLEHVHTVINYFENTAQNKQKRRYQKLAVALNDMYSCLALITYYQDKYLETKENIYLNKKNFYFYNISFSTDKDLVSIHKKSTINGIALKMMQDRGSNLDKEHVSKLQNFFNTNDDLLDPPIKFGLKRTIEEAQLLYESDKVELPTINRYETYFSSLLNLSSDDDGKL